MWPSAAHISLPPHNHAAGRAGESAGHEKATNISAASLWSMLFNLRLRINMDIPIDPVKPDVGYRLGIISKLTRLVPCSTPIYVPKTI